MLHATKMAAVTRMMLTFFNNIDDRLYYVMWQKRKWCNGSYGTKRVFIWKNNEHTCYNNCILLIISVFFWY
jgi:hypothetical protein